MAKKVKEAELRGITSVTVRLDNELVAWLDTRAEQEDRSRANLIEALLKRAVSDPTKDSGVYREKENSSRGAIRNQSVKRKRKIHQAR
jgi:predicted transcriptional regulator